VQVYIVMAMKALTDGISDVAGGARPGSMRWQGDHLEIVSQETQVLTATN